MPGHEARMFELGQHPIYRGQTDFFTSIDQATIDVLGSQMVFGAFLQ